MTSLAVIPGPSPMDARSQTVREPNRKRRRRTKDSQVTEPPKLSPCLFARLPYELLAEVLVFTQSPKDVLAVARTSKYFCVTLLNPSSTFIWKTVREAYPVPPPEPLSIFTEVAYAAFLFGGGTCEMCGKFTEALYLSFGIRLMLCQSFECKKKYAQRGDYKQQNRELSHDSKITQCISYVESNRCFLPDALGNSRTRIYREKDFLQELYDCSERPGDYLDRKKTKIARTKEYMEFCMSLLEWKELRQGLYKSNETANDVFAKALASGCGWAFWDMMNSTPYGPMHRLKNKRIESVTQHDYDVIATEVDQALVKLAGDRKRKASEVAYAKNREGVALHYQRLKSQHPPPVLPSLPMFRRLPIVAILQGSSPSSITYPSVEHPASVSKMLSSERWVVERVNADLRSWVEQAKRGLADVLGFPGWSTAKKTILHPVDRITARFVCKDCSKIANRYREDECLDFSGACEHLCPTTNKSLKLWQAERFTKDNKAIGALSRLVEMCKLDESLAVASILLETLGDTILCVSCQSGLLLNAKAVVGHSHRHERMEMRLLSPEQGSLFTTHLPAHSIVRALRGSHPKAEAMRNLWNYGCRHCFNFDKKLLTNLTIIVGKDEVKVQGSEERNLKKGAKESTTRFTFNGLYSHLHAKHGIPEPRDEDVFVYEAIDYINLLKNGRLEAL